MIELFYVGLYKTQINKINSQIIPDLKVTNIRVNSETELQRVDISRVASQPHLSHNVFRT